MGAVECCDILLHHCPSLESRLGPDMRSHMHGACSVGSENTIEFLIKRPISRSLLSKHDVDGVYPFQLIEKRKIAAQVLRNTDPALFGGSAVAEGSALDRAALAVDLDLVRYVLTHMK